MSQEWTGVRGKRVILTGATNGIGLAAARRLAALGAELAIVARNPERAARAVETIRQAAPDAPPADVLIADLAAQASVRRLADEILERYPRIQILVNNAGAMYGRRELSEDGIEMTWALNHLAPFLLTNLLLERLKASAPARIVTTASAAHYGAHIPFEDLNAERGYDRIGFRRYGESKLANILFTAELARRLAGTGVTANCFHPGVVATGFNHNNGVVIGLAMSIMQLFSRRPERGAETLVWLADSPQVEHTSGAYFFDKRQIRPSVAARDPEIAGRLWEVSEQQTALTAAA